MRFFISRLNLSCQNMISNGLKFFGCFDLVYADKPDTMDHLEDNFYRVINGIRRQMLKKVVIRPSFE